MTKKKFSSRAGVRAVAAALLLGLGLTAVVAQSASASTTSFGHYMGGSGGIYWWADVYNHSVGGSITISPTSVPSCGGTVDVGLWSPQTGSQFTQSQSFSSPGTRTFVNAASGSTYISPVGFSIDARRTGMCGNTSPTDPITWFGGSISY